jgi:beta-lactamase superfamily II metal-dependent hydrolase
MRRLVPTRIRTALAVAALCLSFTTSTVASQPVPPPAQPLPLIVRFLDVGQGEGAWLTTPDGQTILIDCGPLSYGRRLAVDLHAAGVERIAVLAPSHAHADHMGGCIEILRQFPVDQLLWTGQTDTSLTWRTFWSEVQQRQVPITEIEAGQVLEWGGGVTASVYNPGPRVNTRAINEYDDSHVLLVEYLGTRLLFVGDVHARGERQAVAAGLPRVHILKVAEHGSNSGSSADFLAAIQPRLAILSYATPNAFDLPNPAVLERLTQAGIPVLTTAEHGTLTITVDGYSVATDR